MFMLEQRVCVCVPVYAFTITKFSTHQRLWFSLILFTFPHGNIMFMA